MSPVLTMIQNALAEVGKIERAYEDARADVKSMERRNDVLQDEVHEKQDRIAELETEARELRAENAALRAANEELRAALVEWQRGLRTRLGAA